MFVNKYDQVVGLPLHSFHISVKLNEIKLKLDLFLLKSLVDETKQVFQVRILKGYGIMFT